MYWGRRNCREWGESSESASEPLVSLEEVTRCFLYPPVSVSREGHAILPPLASSVQPSKCPRLNTHLLKLHIFIKSSSILYLIAVVPQPRHKLTSPPKGSEFSTNKNCDFHYVRIILVFIHHSCSLKDLLLVFSLVLCGVLLRSLGGKTDT